MKIDKLALSSNIDEIFSRAKNALEKYDNIIFAYLFGGLARGRISPISDIDIAVYLKDVGNLIEVKLEILSLLSEALNTEEIDLVMLNFAPLPLRARIIQNKRVV